MNRVTKLVIVGMLVASPAFADDDDATAAVWPAAIIDRPLALPNGMYSGIADVSVARESTTVAGKTTTATGEGLGLVLAYGLLDKVEVGAQYVQSLRDADIGPFDLYGAASIISRAKLSVAVSAGLGLELSGATRETLGFGIAVRYKLSPGIAIISNTVVAPDASANLSIGLNSGAPVTFGVPIGVALQPLSSVYLSASTVLATIGVSNSSSTVLFADNVPLQLVGLLALSPHLDAGVYFDFPDLEHAGTYNFGFTARYFGGR